MSISALAANSTSENANVNGSRQASNTKNSSSSSNGLSMDDFFQLLAAQFQNQDIMNPTDNTEYISEMAQFASIQAMNTLTSYADSQYAASLVGKNVVVASYDNTGNLVTVRGVVDYVDFSSADGSSVVVNGHAYSVANVMQVLSSPTSGTDPSDPGKTDPTGDGGTPDPGTADPAGGDDAGT